MFYAQWVGNVWRELQEEKKVRNKYKMLAVRKEVSGKRRNYACALRWKETLKNENQAEKKMQNELHKYVP